MAKKKAKSSTIQHKTRPGKRLGIKIFGSELVKIGQIIVRQKGTQIMAGEGVGVGRDHTLYALRNGRVNFQKIKGKQIIKIV